MLTALSLAIPPRARATGFSDRLALGHPRSARAALRRMDRRHLEHSRRHARDDADLRHRCDHPAQRSADVIDDDIKQVWQSAVARSERALRPPARQHDPVARPRCRGRLRRATRVARRQPRTPGGRDRRLARHQRRREVDAVEGDQRCGRGRPRRDRARRARHHARPTERDRRARHRADARRQGRVRFADRAGEPRTVRMDQPARPGRRQGSDRRGPRDIPDPRRTTRRPGGKPVRRPAADAGPGHELHHAAEGSADRRVVARAGTGDRRPTAADRATDGRATA